MLGIIANVIAIITGALLGNVLKTGIPENFKTTIMQGLSMAVIIIGLTMALQTGSIMILTLSMVLGGIAGELLKIEARLNAFGSKIEQRFGSKDNSFTKAFVSASLIFCVGAMAIMGSLESGLTGNHTTLYIKSLLDGVASIIFASSMGIGVAFSAIPVFLYQGSITMLASLLKAFFTDTVIREMTAAGGLLIMGIGINILTAGRFHIKVGNLLPAIFVAVILVLMAGKITM